MCSFYKFEHKSADNVSVFNCSPTLLSTQPRSVLLPLTLGVVFQIAKNQNLLRSEVFVLIEISVGASFVQRQNFR